MVIVDCDTLVSFARYNHFVCNANALGERAGFPAKVAMLTAKALLKFAGRRPLKKPCWTPKAMGLVTREERSGQLGRCIPRSRRAAPPEAS